MTDGMVEVSEHAPEDHDWYADAVLECDIHAERPLRLLDGAGQSPRGMLDPLTTAPGHWGVRLYARYREPDYGPILLIWPWGAPTREEADRAECDADGVEYLDADEWGDLDLHHLPSSEHELFSVVLSQPAPADEDFLTWLRFLEMMPRDTWRDESDEPDPPDTVDP